MYIDSHCHLSKEYYENLDEIVNKAKENNVNITGRFTEFLFLNTANDLGGLKKRPCLHD